MNSWPDIDSFEGFVYEKAPFIYFSVVGGNKGACFGVVKANILRQVGELHFSVGILFLSRSTKHHQV